MVKAVSKSIFSSSYDIKENGEPVSEVNFSNWSEKAELTIGGKKASFYRQGIVSGDFVFEFEDRILATAEKPSAWKDDMVIKVGEQFFEIRPKSWFSYTYYITWQGQQIGKISRDGWVTQNGTGEFPEDWPAALKVFVFILVLLLWRRTDSAAASGS